jgi:hypothetical protein
LFAGLQVSSLFHPIQQWIQHSGTELVAISGKLIDDSLTVDFVLCRMVQDVQAQPVQQILELHFRNPLSNPLKGRNSSLYYAVDADDPSKPMV